MITDIKDVNPSQSIYKVSQLMSLKILSYYWCALIILTVKLQVLHLTMNK